MNKTDTIYHHLPNLLYLIRSILDHFQEAMGQITSVSVQEIMYERDRKYSEALECSVIYIL